MSNYLFLSLGSQALLRIWQSVIVTRLNIWVNLLEASFYDQGGQVSLQVLDAASLRSDLFNDASAYVQKCVFWFWCVS